MQINGIWLIKSGTDFRNFTTITLTFSSDWKFDRTFDINAKVHDVTSEYEPDAELVASLKVYNGKMFLRIHKYLHF